MSEWTESTLRGAASWKAFKDGKGLFEMRAVSGAKAAGAIWSGTVKDGKRSFKTALKMISPTNLETRCGCVENQSTGALCSHGVAVGLAILGSPAEAPVVAGGPKPAPAVEVGFEVALPVNWRESLKRGRLSATLSESKEPGDSDRRICEWLGVVPKFPLYLNLDEEKTGSFLRAVTGHPRVSVGKTKQTVEVEEGGRLPLQVDRQGERVVMRGEGGLFRSGTDWWQVTDDSLRKLGNGTVDGDLNDLLEQVAISGRGWLPLRLFLARLGQWQDFVAFPEADWLSEIHFVPAKAEFLLEVEGSLRSVEARLKVRYGGDAPVPPGLGAVGELPRLEGDRCWVRDWEREKKAVGRLVDFGFKQQGELFTLGGELLVEGFLLGGLPRLEEEWQVSLGQRFQTAKKQVVVVSPKIEILGSGEDWLQFDLKFQTNEGAVVSREEIRRLLRSGQSGSGRKMIVSSDVSSLIEPLFGELDLKQESGHFVASKRSEEVIEEIRKKIEQPDRDQQEQSISYPIDLSRIRADLRPYQTHGAGWLIDRAQRFGGALLADDMGLGKTLQAIACIEHLLEDGGVALVIATASLLGNWKAEFGKFAPDRKVRILHGPERERVREEMESGDVLLTTYGTLPRDLAWYLKQEFKAVVVDEASLMRNPDTDHAKAISRLNASARIALTGTPIENGVRDLWSIFRFIQPGWLGGKEEFRERYERDAGDTGAMSRLKLKTSPFLLRRTKEEVAPELPSKIVIEERCELSGEQQAVYRDLLQEGRKRVDALNDAKQSGAARMQVLTALLRLRQTCCDLALLGNDRFKQLSVPKRSGKLERVLELVEEAISGGHRILVFSQFQKQLQEIEKCLGERAIDCLKLDGQTRNRQVLVDRFQEAGGPPVFLISLKAGGYGLNLTAADVVIHFDPWWNPAAEAQATDRAHRIGQTRPVTVYRMITRGTVEEKVVSLQEKKKRIAMAIDESGSGDAAGWSDRDLADLFSA